MHCPHACLQHGTYFLHGSMSGLCFVLCLPTLWVVLPLGLCGWFSLLSFWSSNAATSNFFFDLPTFVMERQSKIWFFFSLICHLSPQTFKLFLALWRCSSFCGTKCMFGGLNFSFRCLCFSFFYTLCLSQIYFNLAWKTGLRHQSLICILSDVLLW